jgi:hypothetical protein
MSHNVGIIIGNYILISNDTKVGRSLALSSGGQITEPIVVLLKIKTEMEEALGEGRFLLSHSHALCIGTEARFLSYTGSFDPLECCSF